jgi:hypothetical protein
MSSREAALQCSRGEASYAELEGGQPCSTLSLHPHAVKHPACPAAQPAARGRCPGGLGELSGPPESALCRWAIWRR